MSLLTLEFIGLLLAAWKAPGWVKEAGLLALVTGILGFLFGFCQISGVVHEIGEISPALIFGGLRVAVIAMIYGCIIYAVSLALRIVQKPKLF